MNEILQLCLLFQGNLRRSAAQSATSYRVSQNISVVYRLRGEFRLARSKLAIHRVESLMQHRQVLAWPYVLLSAPMYTGRSRSAAILADKLEEAIPARQTFQCREIVTPFSAVERIDKSLRHLS